MTKLSTRLFLFKKFVQFYRQASTVHGIRSPLVREMAQHVVQDDRNFYAFPIIARLRSELLSDSRPLKIVDLGAGSKADPLAVRPVKSVARHSAVEARVGKMLFRLVNWRKPKQIIELGTSLGISTLYQASAALNAKVVTVEGCPDIAQQAGENFRKMGLGGIQVMNRSFEEGLGLLLPQMKQIDYVFLDGDHRPESSIRYFEKLLPHLQEESLFLLADIYWSEEMQEAWKELQQHPSVTLTVDFYHFGILIFRKDQPNREHYKVVPANWKPWIFSF